MVTIGADLHKRSHTLVAVDARGRKLGERTASATPAGHLALLRWARERFTERHWALEDCRHLSRGFERDLFLVAHPDPGACQPVGRAIQAVGLEEAEAVVQQ